MPPTCNCSFAVDVPGAVADYCVVFGGKGEQKGSVNSAYLMNGCIILGEEIYFETSLRQTIEYRYLLMQRAKNCE